MTNRQWLESIDIPDGLAVCDDNRDGSCSIMLRIAYEKQPWQTRKSIMIAKTLLEVNEALSLARWLNAEYDRNRIFVGEDIIRRWYKSSL